MRVQYNNKGYFRKGDTLNLFKEEIEEYDIIVFSDKFQDEMHVSCAEIRELALETHQSRYVIPREYFRKGDPSKSVSKQPSFDPEFVKQMILADIAARGNGYTDPESYVKQFVKIAEAYENQVQKVSP